MTGRDHAPRRARHADNGDRRYFAALWALGLESEIEDIASPDRDAESATWRWKSVPTTATRTGRIFLSACPRFRLPRDEADALISRMKRVVTAKWREKVVAAGGSKADCAAVERAFCYPGFEYDPR